MPCGCLSWSLLLLGPSIQPDSAAVFTQPSLTPSLQISRDEVVTHFSQFGPIKSCVLLTHKDTGKPKGCAMVLYHKWGHAETAVEQNNGAVSDMSSPRPLIVKFADPQRCATAAVATSSRGGG